MAPGVTDDCLLVDREHRRLEVKDRIDRDHDHFEPLSRRYLAEDGDPFVVAAGGAADPDGAAKDHHVTAVECPGARHLEHLEVLGEDGSHCFALSPT